MGKPTAKGTSRGGFASRHTQTRTQLEEKARRRRNTPGGKRQPKGTPPTEYRPVDKPVFKPIPPPEFGLRKVLDEILPGFRRREEEAGKAAENEHTTE